MEDGITADPRILAGKLGLSPDNADVQADLQAALKEFQPHPEDPNKLMHPRTWAIILEQRQRVEVDHASASKRNKLTPPLRVCWFPSVERTGRD